MIIDGPAGALQAEFTVPGQSEEAAAGSDRSLAAAVLCHPHPQYGGSMHDPVLAAVETALLAASTATLRFNFRGVGGSDGSYSGGEGELADLQAVVAWLRECHQPSRLLLAGYSFGAAVVWRGLPGLKPDRVLLLAPPVSVMDFEPGAPGIPVDVFAGDRDDYVDADGLKVLSGASVHMLSGADHFFSGCLEALQQRVSAVLASAGC